jgi:hypothetical protein
MYIFASYIADYVRYIITGICFETFFELIKPQPYDKVINP